MQIFRIEGRDESLIQSGKKLMGNLICIVLDPFDLAGHPGQRQTVGAYAFVQEARCFDDSVRLFFQEVEEFFIAGKKSHCVLFSLQHEGCQSTLRCGRQSSTLSRRILNRRS